MTYLQTAITSQPLFGKAKQPLLFHSLLVMRLPLWAWGLGPNGKWEARNEEDPMEKKVIGAPA